jgi:phosphate starvation-inducible protein PhoH and related proteins
MPKKTSPSRSPRGQQQRDHSPRTPQGKDFHIELLNTAQKLAWQAFQQHDVLFLIGPAGCGKTHLSTAFAIKTFLAKECSKIILTRPIVEAGESLGFLPGTFEEKVDPYMAPIYDCMDKLIGREGPHRERVIHNTEVAPLAYLRGRTFSDAVCIFDEAQNASMKQLKLFLTRFSEGSKIIITGDPSQSDLPSSTVALSEVVRKLSDVVGIGIVEFKNNSIVRHPLVGQIIDRLGE